MGKIRLITVLLVLFTLFRVVITYYDKKNINLFLKYIVLYLHLSFIKTIFELLGCLPTLLNRHKIGCLMSFQLKMDFFNQTNLLL
jgi:hypothetical protein